MSKLTLVPEDTDQGRDSLTQRQRDILVFINESIRLRGEGDGRYQADFSVEPSDPAFADRLTAAGFAASPNGYRLSVEGRF